MPFGIFGIDGIKEKNPKSEEKKRVEKIVTSQPIKEPIRPKEIEIDPSINSNIQAEVPEEKYNPPAWDIMSDGKLSVLIIGETGEVISDFICSMWQNINEIFPEAGISCSTTDSKTLSEMATTKKGIEKCFWGADGTYWPQYSEQGMTSAKQYSFIISRAGQPQKSVSLEFFCATPENATNYISRASVVWILTNGKNLPEEHGMQTSYESAIKQFLYNGQALKGKFVEFIICHFEKFGCFNDSGASGDLSAELKGALYLNCKNQYRDAVMQAGITAKMCLSQIYGGLELYKYDEYSRPMFYMNPDGKCAGYTPVACHIPLLHTFEAIRNTPNGYFSFPDGEEMWLDIQSSFSDYIGIKRWTAQIID